MWCTYNADLDFWNGITHDAWLSAHTDYLDVDQMGAINVVFIERNSFELKNIYISFIASLGFLSGHDDEQINDSGSVGICKAGFFFHSNARDTYMEIANCDRDNMQCRWRQTFSQSFL